MRPFNAVSVPVAAGLIVGSLLGFSLGALFVTQASRDTVRLVEDRHGITQAMALTEVVAAIESGEGLAAHWGRILGAPAAGARIALPNAAIRIVAGAREMMSALTFRVRDPAAVLASAQARGYPASRRGFNIGGVDFELTT